MVALVSEDEDAEEEEGRWHWDCGLCEASSYDPGSETRREAEQKLKRHLRDRCDGLEGDEPRFGDCTVYKEPAEA